ncbi:MAG: aminopeptidase [Deltaproteobacteria bacterium]|nr:aminopeptidase [Deltaproteobacteria bacterium]
MKKQEIERISEKLTAKRRLVWDALDQKDKGDVWEFDRQYRDFLNSAKTEREAVIRISEIAEKSGFSPHPGPTPPVRMVKPFLGKSIALCLSGKQPLEEGLNLIVSHLDSPRLDLKQNPLYEDIDLAFMKTHYYGGIKKFQWLTRPLAIHGRVIRSDGSPLDIVVGEDDADPVFTVADILPHLARKVQTDKKVSEAFEGEKLNLMVGSIPFGNKDTKDRFKLAVLKLLNERYGLVEEDLISAELEVVPAGGARDVGWDRGLTGAYGHDDRSCAFTSLRAIVDLDSPRKTAIVLFVDKEEIGSDGATGAKSKFLESVVADLLTAHSKEPLYHEIHKILMNSRAISADVNGAIDPDFQDVHEKKNAARLGYGICLTKFTGSGGKYGASDANAEYVGWLRNLFNKNKVVWQTGELGKVDEGGGGTVAKFLAPYGMEIIDCGPPVLSMHSPFEIAHKGDIYMTYKGFKVFMES